MSSTFGTQNIRHSENQKNLQETLSLVQKKFPGDLSVLAMQELTGSHRSWVLSALPGWDYLNKMMPEGQNGTGLAWKRESWALIRKGTRMIYKPGRDGPVEVYEGKRQNNWRRFASWVTLSNKENDQVCSFISVHGKLGASGKDVQWKHLHRLVKYLLTFGPVQIAGDLNTHFEDLPKWLQDAVVFSDKIDHIAQLGEVKKIRSFVISEEKLEHLVDHPGVAIRWNFK